MNPQPQHRAPQTPSSIVHDIGQGVIEGFEYRDRAGKYRAGNINAEAAA